MTSEEVVQPSALQNLRKQWVVTAVLSAASLLAGYYYLQNAWESQYTARWLVFSLIGFTYLLYNLWSGLIENHPLEYKELLPTLGAGNALTLFRGAMIALLLGFVASPRPDGWLAWLPGILYTLAAIVDLFDGYLARITHHTTHLGELLDLKLDGLGMFVAAMLAVSYRQVPAWYLLVGLARILFVAGIWLRRRLGKSVYDLAPSAGRRPVAGVQMGFLAVMLWPLFSPPGTYLAATLFALPFLLGFVRDWLCVSGVIKQPGADVTEESQSFPRRVLDAWLPLLLRISVVALVVLTWTQRLPTYTGMIPGSSLSRLSSLHWAVLVTILLAVGGSLLLAFGAAGRFATVAILFSVGLHQRLSNLTALDILIIIAATALFFLGTGAYSLWKPEDRFIQYRLGEV
ncbi:MAG TPA: CDP-alcohol phosphatidyltransferase family protein [Anaerolineales bacterium]